MKPDLNNKMLGFAHRLLDEMDKSEDLGMRLECFTTLVKFLSVLNKVGLEGEGSALEAYSKAMKGDGNANDDDRGTDKPAALASYKRGRGRPRGSKRTSPDDGGVQGHSVRAGEEHGEGGTTLGSILSRLEGDG